MPSTTKVNAVANVITNRSRNIVMPAITFGVQIFFFFQVIRCQIQKLRHDELLPVERYQLATIPFLSKRA
jgi:hypothetical protein